jgi:hypothetical protein
MVLEDIRLSASESPLPRLRLRRSPKQSARPPVLLVVVAPEGTTDEEDCEVLLTAEVSESDSTSPNKRFT